MAVLILKGSGRVERGGAVALMCDDSGVSRVELSTLLFDSGTPFGVGRWFQNAVGKEM